MVSSDKRSLNAQAFDMLRRDIISCKLKPGAVITEAWLAEHYSFGKAAIRHALARLTQQGLTVNQRRLGYKVALITIKSIRESYQVRKLIEPELCRLAAGNLDEESYKQLKDCCSVSWTKDNAVEILAGAHANHTFHTLIARCAGNQRMARYIEELSDEHLRIAYVSMRYNRPEEGWSSDHSKILDAIAAGEGDHAAQIMSEHLHRGEEVIMRTILNSPDIIEMPLN